MSRPLRGWRIHTVADDWVHKGFHITTEGVELMMRPDHLGEILFVPFFSRTGPRVDVAIRSATLLLQEPEFITRAREACDRALLHLVGITGRETTAARSKLAEIHFLRIALLRRETR